MWYLAFSYISVLFFISLCTNINIMIKVYLLDVDICEMKNKEN